MDRPFYLKFIETCAQNRQHLENLAQVIEQQLGAKPEIMVRVKENSELPVITAKIAAGSKLVKPQGGLATIPVKFSDDEIRLVPVFIHESESVEARNLDYEMVHITALLDRQGEYADYHRYFLQAPSPESSPADKLAYLKHIARRILIHDQEAFFLLHPGKEKKTVRSLLLYQLGERLAWFMKKLAVDEEATTDELVVFLDDYAASDDFYRDFSVGAYFRQTLVAMTLFQ